VASRGRSATGEGRLLASELEERLGAAFSARTYGELDLLVSDLPVVRERGDHMLPLWARATLVLAAALAVLAVAALAVLIVLGVAAAWMLWVVVAWMFLGRGYRSSGHRGRRGGRTGCSRNHAIAAHPAKAGARIPGGVRGYRSGRPASL